MVQKKKNMMVSREMGYLVILDEEKDGQQNIRQRLSWNLKYSMRKIASNWCRERSVKRALLSYKIQKVQF